MFLLCRGFCGTVVRGGRSPLPHGSDASRGYEHVSLSASTVTGTTVAAGVQLASWLALSFVFFTLNDRFCGLASQCHARTDAKEMSAVPEAVFASTNKHASGALIRKNVQHEYREGGASHG